MDEEMIDHLLQEELEDDPDSDSTTSSDFFVDDSDEDPDYRPDGSPRWESNQGTYNYSDSDSEMRIEDNVPLSSRLQNQPLAHEQRISGWSDVNIEELNNIEFNVNGDVVGINPDLIDTLIDGQPHDFYNLFLDDEVLNYLVQETNRYAEQCKATNKNKYAVNNWCNTDPQEMKMFLGIVMYMGLVPMSSIRHYWKKDEYFNTKISQTMPRFRFESMLTLFHCANNENAQGGRLAKIQPLVQMMTVKFKQWYAPEEKLCIDESVVPFLGRLLFKQYLKNKRHRYGIKIFKVRAKDYYTLEYNVYSGKGSQTLNESLFSTNIVLNMTEPYLDCGRTIYMDNWYSSVDLAKRLLDRNTNMVGTLRANRRGNPPEVVGKKLKKGEVVAQQKEGVLVLKWKDKRDLLMISTKHDNSCVDVQKRGLIQRKPKVVMDYNDGKSFIDRNDQMGSYASPLRKSLKWYRKIAFDVLLTISVVNSLSLFQTVTSKQITITAFKEHIFKYLCFRPSNIEPISEQSHKLISAPRKRCSICYAKILAAEGYKVAQNKTPRPALKCTVCKSNQCMACFFEIHYSKLVTRL